MSDSTSRWGEGFLKWYYDYDRRAAEARDIFDGHGELASNAFAHGYLSATLGYDHGPRQARMLGDWRERLSPGEAWDSFKDLWNNEVGRRIAEHVARNRLHRDNIPALLADAFANGFFIVAPDDPRIPPRGGPGCRMRSCPTILITPLRRGARRHRAFTLPPAMLLPACRLRA